MKSPQDWVSKPLYCLLWWIAPVAVAVLADHLTTGRRISVLAWAVALAWMGLGCLLNARRCHRRHCYLTGPILLVTATVLGLDAAGVLSLGSSGINMVLWGAFGLSLLSFVPELIWGKYVRDISA